MTAFAGGHVPGVPVLFAANAVGWLGEVAAGLLLFQVLLLVARVFVELFYGRAAPVAWALRAGTEPVARRFRRLTAPLGLRFDLAPVAAAIAFYVAHLLVLAGTHRLAGAISGWVPRVRFPFPLNVLQCLLWAYLFLVVLRVAVTWFGSPEYDPFVRFLRRAVDPALRPLRRLLRPRWGGPDWAPLALLAGLWFVDRVVLETAAQALVLLR